MTYQRTFMKGVTSLIPKKKGLFCSSPFLIIP